MFISGLIYSPLLNLFNGEKSEIDDCIQWADEKYDSVCKNSDTGVAILYLREQSVYRSLIVTHNGVQKRYDDSKMVAHNYNDLHLEQSMMELLIKNSYVVIKKYKKHL